MTVKFIGTCDRCGYEVREDAPHIVGAPYLGRAAVAVSFPVGSKPASTQGDLCSNCIAELMETITDFLTKPKPKLALVVPMGEVA